MADREVTLKLSAKADGDPAKPLKDMAKAAEDLNDKEKKYQSLLKNRIDAYHTEWRLKTDLERLGVGREERQQQEREKLRAEQKREQDRLRIEQDRERKRSEEERERQRQYFFQSIPGIALGGVRAATGLAHAAQAPFLSGEQRLQAAGHALGQMGGTTGVIGETVAALVQFKQVIDGTILSFHRLGYMAEIIPWSAQKSGQLMSLEHQGDFLVAQQRARAAAIGATIPGIQAGSNRLIGLAGERGTLQGELRFQQESQRFGARIAIGRAQAEADAAQKAHEVAQEQVKRSQAQIPLYQRDLHRAQKRLGAAYEGQNHIPGTDLAFGNQKAINEGLEGVMQAQEAGLARIRTLEEDIKRAKEAQVASAEKQRELENARINSLKIEQQILAQKEQRQSTAATAIGRMNPAERMKASMALSMIEKGIPLNRIPPSFRQGLEAAVPGFMQRKYEAAGENTDLYKRLQKAGAVDLGTIRQTRIEQQKIEAQVQVKVAINEQAFAEKIANAISAEFKGLIKAIEAKIEFERQQKQTGQMLRNASGH